MRDDPFNLKRFVDAQASVYKEVQAELSRCRKTSHWIWFIFPQLYGLGRSATSQKYGIKSRDEAQAYLAHPILGARLLECTALVCDCEGASIGEILPYPDDLKFQSSMTLFDAVSENPEFAAALDRFFGGARDNATLALLGS